MYEVEFLMTKWIDGCKKHGVLLSYVLFKSKTLLLDPLRKRKFRVYLYIKDGEKAGLDTVINK